MSRAIDGEKLIEDMKFLMACMRFDGEKLFEDGIEMLKEYVEKVESGEFDIAVTDGQVREIEEAVEQIGDAAMYKPRAVETLLAKLSEKEAQLNKALKGLNEIMNLYSASPFVRRYVNEVIQSIKGGRKE